MSRLSWITDDDLEKIICDVLSRTQKMVVEASVRMKQNVIDPFSSLVMAASMKAEDVNQLVAAQQMSSAAQGISNAVGDFHQQILASVPGFRNHDAGYDLESETRRILAEVKNKHNTMNSSNREKVEGDLYTAVRQKSGSWSAYLVIMIPKTPTRYLKKLRHRRVFECDGATFYDIATGSSTALHDLYHAAAEVVSDLNPNLVSRPIFDYCKNALVQGIPR